MVLCPEMAGIGKGFWTVLAGKGKIRSWISGGYRRRGWPDLGRPEVGEGFWVVGVAGGVQYRRQGSRVVGVGRKEKQKNWYHL